MMVLEQFKKVIQDLENLLKQKGTYDNEVARSLGLVEGLGISMFYAKGQQIQEKPSIEGEIERKLIEHRVLSAKDYNPISFPYHEEERIGIDEKIVKLEEYIRAYAQSGVIKPVILRGESGTGKTLSIEIVEGKTRDISDLRFLIIDALSDVPKLSEIGGYKIVGVIDITPEMALRPGLDTVFEDIKFMPIFCTDPYTYGRLSEPFQEKFGKTRLDYRVDDNQYNGFVERLCQKYEVPFSPSLLSDLKRSKGLSLRDAVYYVRAEFVRRREQRA